MDRSNNQYWEWISPEDGLLVYIPEGLEEFEITGEHLFGFVTYGKNFSNGFEALSQLDKNQDGIISGEELESNWIWKDLNTNARLEKGELKPIGDYSISSLPCDFLMDDEGNVFNDMGAIVEGENENECLQVVLLGF